MAIKDPPSGPINISAEYLKAIRGNKSDTDTMSAEDKSRASALRRVEDKILDAKTRSSMLDVSSSKAYSESVKKFTKSIESLTFITSKLKAASIDVGSDRLNTINQLSAKAKMASSVYMAGTNPSGKAVFKPISQLQLNSAGNPILSNTAFPGSRNFIGPVNLSLKKKNVW